MMFSSEQAMNILKLKSEKIEVEVKNIEAQPIWNRKKKSVTLLLYPLENLILYSSSLDGNS